MRNVLLLLLVLPVFMYGQDVTPNMYENQTITVKWYMAYLSQ